MLKAFVLYLQREICSCVLHLARLKGNPACISSFLPICLLSSSAAMVDTCCHPGCGLEADGVCTECQVVQPNLPLVAHGEGAAICKLPVSWIVLASPSQVPLCMKHLGLAPPADATGQEVSRCHEHNPLQASFCKCMACKGKGALLVPKGCNVAKQPFMCLHFLH